MMNRTELDVRFMNHAARVDHADRFGALCDPPRPARRAPHRLLATLLSRRSLRPVLQGPRTSPTDAAIS